jgi:hypothetical protein
MFSDMRLVLYSPSLPTRMLPRCTVAEEAVRRRHHHPRDSLSPWTKQQEYAHPLWLEADSDGTH